LEIYLWNPDENGVIRRTDHIPDTIPGLDRFRQVVLHQGRIERFFLDAITACSDIKVERGVLPAKLELNSTLIDESDAYPITVTLRYLSEEELTLQQAATSANGTSVQDGLFRSNLASNYTADLLNSAELSRKANTKEVVYAKYMVGADGAHSWVRSQLGFQLEGESTDYILGVLDIVLITDFPDTRMRCAIYSHDVGSVMVIPRENKLVRLYIQLTTTGKTGKAKGAKVGRSKITPETILQSAQRILHAYKITYRELGW
jgi:phenol 2-monooxygenase